MGAVAVVIVVAVVVVVVLVVVVVVVVLVVVVFVVGRCRCCCCCCCCVHSCLYRFENSFKWREYLPFFPSANLQSWGFRILPGGLASIGFVACMSIYRRAIRCAAGKMDPV